MVNRLTIRQAASSSESLRIFCVGASVALPVFVGYTVFIYRALQGKATPLEY